VATSTRSTASGGRWASPGLWLRILKIAAAAAVCFVAGTAGALTGFLQRTAARVARNDPGEVKAASSQLTAPQSGKPVDILMIGSDRRVGQPDLGARSDTLLVVRLDSQTVSISMLSVPRDLLGVPINDLVDIDFDGSKQIVNKLGGAYLMIDARCSNNTATDD